MTSVNILIACFQPPNLPATRNLLASHIVATVIMIAMRTVSLLVECWQIMTIAAIIRNLLQHAPPSPEKLSNPENRTGPENHTGQENHTSQQAIVSLHLLNLGLRLPTKGEATSLLNHPTLILNQTHQNHQNRQSLQNLKMKSQDKIIAAQES